MERVFKVEGGSIQVVLDLLAELHRRGDLQGWNMHCERHYGVPVAHVSLTVSEGVEVEIPGVPEYVEPEVSQENPTPTTKPNRGRK